MENKKNKFLSIITATILIIVIFIIGYFFGQKNISSLDKVLGLSNKNSKVITNADFDPFWKVWNTLNEKSIHVKNISDQDKVWGAIEGLANSTNDPYTVFFPPSENKLFQEEIHGSFTGIGAEVDKKDGILTVVSPLKDTPAEKSGLKSGDKILKIDNIDTRDMSIDKAISIIRGPRGTSVILTVFREGEKKTKDINIIRDDISIPTIRTEIKDDIFIINFYTFSENSENSFRKAMDEFKDSNLEKMIIDLRGNPGGYLSSAIEITGWFLDVGKIVATQDFGDNRKSENFRSHGPKMFNSKNKLVILVNKGSASASEIMAGALSEYGVGVIVGTQTFGKGSVQELVEITDDTSLKVTVANWLTPKGVSISKQGLTPDYEVNITQEDLLNERDPQLDKAIELLK